MINLAQRYTYEEICGELKHLADIYSEFVIYRTIGKSQDERDIHMIRVGTGMKTLVLTAGIHGHESVNPILLLRMAEEYCEAYWNASGIEKYKLEELFNQYSICFIPVVNPDGYEIALQGFEGVRNPVMRHLCRMKKISPENWKYNARGVDVGRNFPCKSYIQQQLCEYPASEAETRALIQVFREYDTIGYVDFHSRGKVIYYYRNAMPHSYNVRSQRLAKYLQKLSHYTLGKREEEYMSRLNGGSSVNYYSEATGKPALTVETVEDGATYPLKVEYQKESYQEIYKIPLEILVQSN